MQAKTFGEIHMLRHEISEVKKCVTSYISALLSGSGFIIIVFSGFSVINLDNETNNTSGQFEIIKELAIGLSSILISILILFLFMLIMYKFVSHNRYAGYCLLLSTEKWETPLPGDQTNIENVFGWEWCLERVRERDQAIAAERGSEPWTHYDRDAMFKGCELMFSSLLGSPINRSWGFPITVSRILLCLISLFLFIGASLSLHAVYKYIAQIPFDGSSGYVGELTFIIVILGVLATFFAMHFLAWPMLWARYYNVVQGSYTVAEYSRKFTDVRQEFLAMFGIKSSHFTGTIIGNS